MLKSAGGCFSTHPTSPLRAPRHRDAAALACVNHNAAAAVAASTWRNRVRIGPGGAVLEPISGVFDVTVAPGEDVQAGVNACPPGGSVLLLPGEHAGPVDFPPGAIVHLGGRGRAVLSAASLDSVVSDAAVGTIDGIVLRSTRPAPAADEEDDEHLTGFYVRGGIRIQARGFRVLPPGFWVALYEL